MIRGSVCDRQRRHRRAAVYLDIAHCLFHNGHISTLSWCAAGRPWRGVAPRHLETFQSARSIIHANGGRLRRDDVERLVRVMRERRAAR
jgi:hypothetical protein